jgi:hypothetical protein
MTHTGDRHGLIAGAMARSIVKIRGCALGGLVTVMAGCATPPTVSVAPSAETPRAAVQQAVASRLGLPVHLQVTIERAYADWVFLAGRPLTADREPIDYLVTTYARDMAAGYLDDNFSALTRRRPTAEGGWDLIELSIGATDAPFIGWFERYDLPLDLASTPPQGQ